MLYRSYVFFVPFLCFFELAPLSNAVTLLFLGYLALDCCARLPDGAVEKKKKNGYLQLQSSIRRPRQPALRHLAHLPDFLVLLATL